jgi:ribosomal protein S18 acetylase RimI-like enzyme
MKIRNARTNERDLFEKMSISLFEEDPPGHEMSRKKVRRTFKEAQNHPEKVKIMAFETGGAVIGYAILVFYWSNEFGGDLVSIDELYVLKENRGQGAGTEFMAWLFAQYPEAAGFQLEVTPKNKRARKFYKRLGFKKAINEHLVRE